MNYIEFYCIIYIPSVIICFTIIGIQKSLEKEDIAAKEEYERLIAKDNLNTLRADYGKYMVVDETNCFLGEFDYKDPAIRCALRNKKIRTRVFDDKLNCVFKN